MCGHLPEWPLAGVRGRPRGSPVFQLLDVGCGHKPRGDVNVDLFVEASAHRSVDQRVNDDVALDARSFAGFVCADDCHLPFRDRSVAKVFSGHLIEHLAEPEAFLHELVRVSAGRIEVRCPNGEFKSCSGESKPLHLHDFSLAWFREAFKAFPDWDLAARWDYSQGEPWEIVAEAFRK